MLKKFHAPHIPKRATGIPAWGIFALFSALIIAACSPHADRIAAKSEPPDSVPEQRDVSFVVVGKTSNHRLTPGGGHKLLNYHLFAEIFLRPGGRVQRPVLITPDGQQIAFALSGRAHAAHGGRYQSETELNRVYPDGDYVFSYALSDGRELRQPVRLNVLPNPKGRAIPRPSEILLWQDGRRVDYRDVDPDKDLRVTWSEFESGRADPNGIVDDLIFVITGDCHGRRVNHSGGPFGVDPYLVYGNSEHTVPAGVLYPGETWQLAVEHAAVETGQYEGVIQLATWADTSFVEFTTRGAPLAARDACPSPVIAMDGGQTDRPRRPG